MRRSIYGLVIKVFFLAIGILIVFLLRGNGDVAMEATYHKILSVALFADITFRYSLDKRVLAARDMETPQGFFRFYLANIRADVQNILISMAIVAALIAVDWPQSPVGLLVGFLSALAFIRSRREIIAGRWLRGLLFEAAPIRLISLFAVTVVLTSTFTMTQGFLGMAVLVLLFWLNADRGALSGTPIQGDNRNLETYVASLLDAAVTALVPFLAVKIGGEAYGADVGFFWRLLGLTALPVSVIAAVYLNRFAQLYDKKDQAQAMRFLKTIVLVSAGFAVLASVAIVAALLLMDQFKFKFGTQSLRPEFYFYWVAALINVGCGPTGLMLVVAGGLRRFNFSIFVSALLALVGFVLVPEPRGILIAATVYLTSKNVLAVAGVLKQINRLPPFQEAA